ncbi:hypothetical protein [Intestinimonas butyriciproducens]|uniref:hypothetical protein n=1 Tax=Intestinimonas butyriciproducens TaxID=1297617 RepID=UPI001A9B79E7|nr:hypothetical protein [Intestinimonas butyriciproducens]
MLDTPFLISIFCFLVCIILDLTLICKKLLPLRLHHRAADLPQAHLRNIAGGDAQCVDGGRGVEIIDSAEIFREKIAVCRDG